MASTSSPIGHNLTSNSNHTKATKTPHLTLLSHTCGAGKVQEKRDVAAAAQAEADTAAHVHRGQQQYTEQLRGRQHQKAQVAGPPDGQVEPNI